MDIRDIIRESIARECSYGSYNDIDREGSEEFQMLYNGGYSAEDENLNLWDVGGRYAMDVMGNDDMSQTARNMRSTLRDSNLSFNPEHYRRCGRTNIDYQIYNRHHREDPNQEDEFTTEDENCLHYNNDREYKKRFFRSRNRVR